MTMKTFLEKLRSCGVLFINLFYSVSYCMGSESEKWNSERDREVADSIYQIVRGCYPLELLDTVKWRISYESLVGDDHTTVYQTGPVTSLREFVSAIGDTNIQLLRAGEEREVPVIRRDTVTYDYFTKEFGYIRITGFDSSEATRAALIDAVRYLKGADGIVLDIRGSMNGTIGTAIFLAELLTTQPYEAFRIRTRIPRTKTYKDSSVTIAPRGKRPFKGAIAVFHDQSTSLPLRCFLEAMKARPKTGFTKDGVHYPSFGRGINAQAFALPNEWTLWLPVAVLTDSYGNTKKGSKTNEPNVGGHCCVLGPCPDKRERVRKDKPEYCDGWRHLKALTSKKQSKAQ